MRNKIIVFLCFFLLIYSSCKKKSTNRFFYNGLVEFYVPYEWKEFRWDDSTQLSYSKTYSDTDESNIRIMLGDFSSRDDIKIGTINNGIDNLKKSMYMNRDSILSIRDTIFTINRDSVFAIFIKNYNVNRMYSNTNYEIIFYYTNYEYTNTLSAIATSPLFRKKELDSVFWKFINTLDYNPKKVRNYIDNIKN